VQPILPYALGFGGWRHDFVVVEELIPNRRSAKTQTWPPWRDAWLRRHDDARCCFRIEKKPLIYANLRK
jgi:hypothetical protein